MHPDRLVNHGLWEQRLLSCLDIRGFEACIVLNCVFFGVPASGYLPRLKIVDPSSFLEENKIILNAVQDASLDSQAGFHLCAL